MNLPLLRLLTIGILIVGGNSAAAITLRQWDRFELRLHAPYTGNPFQDAVLEARFEGPDTAFTVRGFYDGGDDFVLRFMPVRQGQWTYTTHSNLAPLNGKTGNFECTAPAGNIHGLVRPNGLHFSFDDGKSYFPFGTTAYAWTHMPASVERQTLRSLRSSGFNKVRMCVFPKNYDLVKEEPERFPFKRSADGKGWDSSRFNPAFFQHLETCIDSLDRLGIQADLILFHPYDKGRWGFDRLGMETNRRYLDYLIARTASFRNIWWSLANEWDYVTARTPADWDTLATQVFASDPYRHLSSIHGATGTYANYWKPFYSHVSIQDESPVQSSGGTAMLRNVYGKPVICDEVGYEGNLRQRWGRYSPEQMTHLIWNGVIGGGYVTHGECYQLQPGGLDTIFWAKGGRFRGTSWKRVAFLRSILEAAPGPLNPTDVARDFRTASAGPGYYLIYFGTEMPQEWGFRLPAKNAAWPKLRPGKRFQVEVIDTWNMTIEKIPGEFETAEERDYYLADRQGKSIRLPARPYIALRITAR